MKSFITFPMYAIRTLISIYSIDLKKNEFVFLLHFFYFCSSLQNFFQNDIDRLKFQNYNSRMLDFQSTDYFLFCEFTKSLNANWISRSISGSISTRASGSFLENKHFEQKYLTFYYWISLLIIFIKVIRWTRCGIP